MHSLIMSRSGVRVRSSALSEWAMLGSNQRPLPCEGSALPRAPVNTMRPGRRIRNLVSLPCTALLFLKLLPTLTAGHHSGLTERGSAAQVVLYFGTCIDWLAAVTDEEYEKD